MSRLLCIRPDARGPFRHLSNPLAWMVLAGSLLLAKTNSAADPATDQFPPELVQFVPVSETPVFTGEANHWDARIRERGWILREDDVYKLWYTGYDGTATGIRRLGYATSADGRTWTRDPRNPLIKEEWVEDMMVVKNDGRYWMFAEGREDRAQLLVSDDGVAWTRLGQLDIRLRNGEPIPDGPYGTPTAWFENACWYLFYERSDLGIWLATSRDLKVFTNLQDDPVLRLGPGQSDKDQMALNQIIKHDGRYYAYYHGSAFSGPDKGMWSTNIATSRDLVSWTKYAGNPLRPASQNISSGIVIPEGSKFRLYTMHPEVRLFEPRQK